MKLIIDKKKLSENSAQFMRGAGYTYIQDYKTGNESFVRRITRDFYPRFHIYKKNLNEKIEFNLHLDQKKASYPGAHAHNAEYEGATVESEIKRIESLVGDEMKWD